jgi:hypothetical protein
MSPVRFLLLGSPFANTEGAPRPTVVLQIQTSNIVLHVLQNNHWLSRLAGCKTYDRAHGFQPIAHGLWNSDRGVGEIFLGKEREGHVTSTFLRDFSHVYKRNQELPWLFICVENRAAVL